MQPVLLERPTSINFTHEGEPVRIPHLITRRAFEKAKQLAGTKYRGCKSVTQLADSVQVVLRVGRSLQTYEFSIKEIQMPREYAVKRSLNDICSMRGLGFFLELLDAAEYLAKELSSEIGGYAVEYPNRYEVDIVGDSRHTSVTVML